MTPSRLEQLYQDFNENFKEWVPDGIIQIGLSSLSEMGLLNKADFDEEEPDDVTHYFHVVETPDKITLYNDTFAVWIVPKLIEGVSTTHTYISQIHGKKPTLELVYETSGIYNSPKFILKVLKHFLLEVIDTENVISSIGKKTK